MRTLLIAGGGIMGLATAWKSAERGARVRLFERRQFGAGSSGRSGAILRQHYRDAVVAAMARDSLREYAGFRACHGLDLGFQRTGVLTLAGPGQPEWRARIRENVAMLLELGIETELVDAARMRALVPGFQVAEGALGAWEPGAGFVDPARTVAAFAALARRKGAELSEGVEVRELLLEGGRVRGLRTSAGDFEGDAVVLVAGPWTHGFCARHGLELPLKVVRPENHYLGVPEMCVSPASGRAEGTHPVLIDLEKGLYARCDPERARTRFGKVEYEGDQVLADPDALDEEVSAELQRWSRAAAASRLPSYAQRPDAGSIAAWYTLTPDAQALIGPVRGLDGLFVVTGFSGHGFKLAPSVGAGVTQMLRGEPVTAFDTRFFALERFRGGERFGGRFGL